MFSFCHLASRDSQFGFCYCRVALRNICLTFDDGPDPIMTPKILDILNKYNVKASFFLIGKNALKNQALVKQITNEGHSIGNHTYHHKAIFPILSKNQMKKEIEKTNNLLEQITSKKVRYFRPPFGITHIKMNIILKQLHLTSIGWDIRSFDTIRNNSIKLFKTVQKGIDEGGTIILFHDRCQSTLAILERLIIYCINKKYNFTTIENV